MLMYSGTTLVNYASVLCKLMSHDAFRSLIEGLLDDSENEGALMIVGLYTAEKSWWAASQTGGREHGVDLQAPVGAIVGAPVSVSILVLGRL